ncbi:MAG TPA: ATP-binding protein, partial [Aestuariivirga sp.]|nr:ATP-binding protein [Aestuariivirga sp.]
IFRILADDERAYATGTHWLLLSMLFSTLLLGLVAALFMRNQVRPIVDLARAAQDFGLGRDTDEFRPRGAAEVRQAGEAFLDMKRRIARHVEQRTAMLAGVSHDLRTILTRFKLELAVLGDSPKVKPLQDDVREMQHMLEAYLAFVRGDEGEQAVATNVVELAAEVAQAMSRSGTGVTVMEVPSLPVRLRPHSFRRLLANVLANALRHGKRVVLSGELRDGRLWLHVDDDGPGIAPESREEVFKPFVRLDTARNLDATGSGLGLSIALDIAHAHGGDILLDDSPLGGLRATIKIPV